jgi:hypothetical protein
MKFTLAYDGPLHSQNSGKVFDLKWRIREFISPQLDELWRTHPSLKHVMPAVPVGGYIPMELHHTKSPSSGRHDGTEYIELREPIEVGGIKFVPLIRDTYALTCSLNILFMRKEPAGRIYQGGDLDNRIKLFLDALKVPRSESDRVAQVSPKPTAPIHCLLEDDGLITGLRVEATRLLGYPEEDENYVRLVVEVHVGITHQRSYNASFLAD